MELETNSLSESELNHVVGILDRFNHMNLEMLDGFFAALICGPKTSLPSVYFPEIWAGEATIEDVFNYDQEKQDFFNLIIRHWNVVGHTLKNGSEYSPLLQADDDDSVDAFDWTQGFMRGVALQGDDWDPIYEDHEAFELLEPILDIAYEHDEDFDGEPVDIDTRVDFINGLAERVIAIYQYFREEIEEKIGVGKLPITETRKPLTPPKYDQNTPRQTPPTKDKSTLFEDMFAFGRFFVLAGFILAVVIASSYWDSSDYIKQNVDKCDRLAAYENDQNRVADAVSFDDLKKHASGAIEACLVASESGSDEPRFRFQLGRSYFAFDDSERGLKIYFSLAKENYPASLLLLGFLYEDGKYGLPKDLTIAATMYGKSYKAGNSRAGEALEEIANSESDNSGPSRISKPVANSVAATNGNLNRPITAETPKLKKPVTSCYGSTSSYLKDIVKKRISGEKAKFDKAFRTQVQGIKKNPGWEHQLTYFLGMVPCESREYPVGNRWRYTYRVVFKVDYFRQLNCSDREQYASLGELVAEKMNNKYCQVDRDWREKMLLP